MPRYRTDHSAVVIWVNCDGENKHGPGLWKLITSFLESKQNLGKLNQSVDEVVKLVEREKCNPSYVWEKVKEAIVRECEQILVDRAQKLNSDIKELHKYLNRIQEQIRSENVSNVECEVLHEQFSDYEKNLKSILGNKTEGAQIRSKIKYYELGEKTTKYFYGLERTKYKNKTPRAVLCANNMITRNEKKILAEQQKFYKKLYSSNPEINFVFTNKGSVGFSQQEKEELDQEFTFEQFTSAARSMSKNKTPGNDGLPIEIYIVTRQNLSYGRVGQLFKV